MFQIRSIIESIRRAVIVLKESGYEKNILFLLRIVQPSFLAGWVHKLVFVDILLQYILI
jgi:hypothetical protein